MAEMKVSEMIEAEQVNDEDLIMIVQNGVNKKVPASKVGTGQAGGEVLPVGSEIEFDGESEEIPVGWEEVDNVLWQNSSPTSDFSGQTITLSSSDYDYLIIFYYRTPASRTETFSSIIEKNQTTELLYHDYSIDTVRSWSRAVNINETSVVFGNCVINGETNNAGLIPYKIVGCK